MQEHLLARELVLIRLKALKISILRRNLEFFSLGEIFH